ncbi:MAG: Fic family protein [Bacteroidales bacterium]|nr:Fic family protein [Bacteroidales bacterium]
MATPSEKLAESLGELKKLQNAKGIAIIKADDLSRTHKERLVENGFIREVIRGWYIAKRPDEKEGDTTSWYASFWNFTSSYTNSRFNKDWCLSPEQSLSLHSGNFSVPKQLLIRSPKASNNKVELLHGTSVFDSKVDIPSPAERIEIEGLQVCALVYGLLACSADFFTRNATDARTCLAMVKDASEILPKLLDGGKSVVAGRLAGAFRNIAKDKIADEIMKTMKSAGYDVRETDPFNDKIAVMLSPRETSPYVNRISIMWRQMRQKVIDNFPKTSGLSIDVEEYLKQVEDNYTEDAYHSLSIEGYRVTHELIERVRSGDWNPGDNELDKEQKNAMAARGYYQAFQAVKKSIRSILEGKNPGEIVYQDHGEWYRELFAPSVTAGILKASDLAGYRNGPVFIQGSLHSPPNHEAVRHALPVLFDLLKEESEPCVRVVLGHFFFVYIHPYFDGNGRIARFLMNSMMASGGYPWTVIPVEKRDEYMDALEKASVHNDITDFSTFISSLVRKKMNI